MGFMEEPIKVLPQSRPPRPRETGEREGRVCPSEGRECKYQDVDQSQNGTFSSTTSDESLESAYKTTTKFREVSGGNGGGLIDALFLAAGSPDVRPCAVMHGSLIRTNRLFKKPHSYLRWRFGPLS